MCGRLRLENDYSETKIAWNPADTRPLNYPPRFNGAPTQDFPILRYETAGKARTFTMMRWGLIPGWAKDDKIGYSTFNARSEELAGKPTFRAAWKAGRRCIVPVTGFYEWKKLDAKGKDKQPYLVTLKDGKVMGLAGLWEERKRDGGEVQRTFTIVTTKANKFMSALHDRMPVILDQKTATAWLNEEQTEPDAAADLMKPCPDKWLAMVPVDKRMGNVKNWQEEFCRPIEGQLDG